MLIFGDSKAYLYTFAFAALNLLQNQFYLFAIEVDPTVAAVPADTTSTLVAVHALKMNIRIDSTTEPIVGTADSAADINCIEEKDAIRLQLQMRPLP